MASIQLAPLDDRKVIRCDQCQLVQFPVKNNLCRRCHRTLGENGGAPETEKILSENLFPLSSSIAQPYERIGATIQTLRHEASLSQRGLATNMGVVRTYISKIENKKVTPSLGSVIKLTHGLGVSMEDFFAETERVPYVKKLKANADYLDAEMASIAGLIIGMPPHILKGIAKKAREAAKQLHYHNVRFRERLVHFVSVPVSH